MRPFACAAALLALASCSSDEDGAAPVLERIEVTPSALTIPAGLSAQLVATAFWSDGSVGDVTEGSSWSSSAPSVVRVSNDAGARGRAQGLAVGPATITGTFEGVSASAAATVVAQSIVSVSISPSPVSLAKGRGTQLVATARWEGGATGDATTWATWASDAPGVATASYGWLQSIEEGTARITATVEGVVGSAQVTVTPAVFQGVRIAVGAGLHPGESSSLAAVAVYSDREEDVTAAASWTIAPDGVVAATFGAAGASVRAIAAGTATLTATYEGETGSANVWVTEARPIWLDVSPPFVDLTVGETVALHASGTYDGRTIVDLTEFVAWGGGNPLVATVSTAPGEEGIVTAHGVGQTGVTATYGGTPTTYVTVNVTGPAP